MVMHENSESSKNVLYLGRPVKDLGEAKRINQLVDKYLFVLRQTVITTVLGCARVCYPWFVQSGLSGCWGPVLGSIRPAANPQP